MIKIRLEGTEQEIKDFMNQNFGGLLGRVKSVSKFYLNRVNSNDFLNGVADTKQGRIYLEIENNKL